MDENHREGDRKMRRKLIEVHPEREQIENDIIHGVSYRKIAEKYGMSNTTVFNYAHSRLKDLLIDSKKMRQWNGDRLVGEIEKILSRAQKLFDALDDYLQDPRDPDKYTVSPRADDIDVVYYDGEVDGKAAKRVAKLQDLIDELRGNEKIVLDHRLRGNDPRKLFLETIDRLGAQLEKIGKIRGEIKDATITIQSSEVWVNFQQIILEELRDFPEVRQALANRLRTPSSDEEPSRRGS